MEPEFTHVQSGQPGMVDIAAKSTNRRIAVAEARVRLAPQIMECLENDDIKGPKGPVFQSAVIAGTMAVKKTAELIPFCHPLPIESCEFAITPLDGEIRILCTVATSGKTGVEMEAMTGASIAALTIYDMCKALDKRIEVSRVRLISKTGGKSGDFHVES